MMLPRAFGAVCQTLKNPEGVPKFTDGCGASWRSSLERQQPGDMANGVVQYPVQDMP
jgi:hypothetical protein